jgi:site-specific recombinase XerD
VWWQNGYKKRSTKTEDKRKALASAREFYDDLRIKRNIAAVPQLSAFQIVANDLIKEDQGRVDRGEASKRLVTDQQYILKADLLKFFGATELKDITYQKINDYIDYLKTRGRKPVGSNTIKRHFVLLSKILKQAHKLQMIQTMPWFPTIKTLDNPREWFSPKEYQTLRKAVAMTIKEKTIVRSHPVTDEMRYLITMMVNCFFRTSDLPILKNQDISAEKGHLLVTLKSKVKTQQIISMPDAVHVFKELTDFNRAKGFGKKDDYVFFPALKNRKFAMQTMRRLFDAILEKGNLKKSSDGKARTLMSLRHTSISFRFLNSVNPDVFLIAQNARTSVDMIQRFYASKLTPQMNIEKLQSMKKSK